MAFYDFIEIGTSDFETELERANGRRGLSIEPLAAYLDKLPCAPNCVKVACAVSRVSGEATLYHVPEEIIREHNLPTWVRGCSSLGQRHPTVDSFLIEQGLDPQLVVSTSQVKVLTFDDIIRHWDVCGLHFLKIDTEGHDVEILESYCDSVMSTPSLRAHRLQFESNSLTSRGKLTKILRRLFELGYLLNYSAEDTTLSLPLGDIKWRYPLRFERYYLAGYPPGYDPNNPPHEQTLEDAVRIAREVNGGGVTLQGGVYTVRAASGLHYWNDATLISWLV